MTLRTALLLAPAMVACEPPPPPGNSTFISGRVFVTAPVSDVEVWATAIDPETGQTFECTKGVRDVPCISDITDTNADGGFTLEITADEWDRMGREYIDLRIVAADFGRTPYWDDPFLGEEVTWDTAFLSALVTRGGESGELEFGVERDTYQPGVLITPLSHLATAYAVDAEAHADVHGRWRARYQQILDHVEFDFLAAEPPTSAGGPSDAGTMRSYLFYTGLSALAERIAVAGNVSSTEVNPVKLAHWLGWDIDDGRLDGHALYDRVEFASCPDDDRHYFCTLSPDTLRGDLAESIALFLMHDPRNDSGIAYEDVADYLARLAGRTAAPFVDPGRPVDGTPPLIVLDGIAEDDEVSGDRAVSAVLTDAFALAEVAPVRLVGDAMTWTEGAAAALDVDRTAVSSREEQLDLVIHTEQLPDGPVTLEVEAVDETGNVEVVSVPIVVANP